MREHLQSGNMPQFPEPYWRDSTNLNSYPKLTEDIKADVAIIGGGITGITNAYLLAKEGVKVALLEAGVVLNGTTGHTTAKITAQHGLIYNEYLNHFGPEKTKLYYQAIQQASQFIKDTIAEHNIDCDLSEEDAYIYTNSKQEISKLEQEILAYEIIGADSEYVESIPIPIDVKAAIVMKKQAQFHPLQYMKHLLDLCTESGVAIYEQTTADHIDQEGDKIHVVTSNGNRVTAEHIISCSHFPFDDGSGFYFSRMYAERSYVLGVRTEKEFPGGMYLSAENPTRSLRYANMNGERLVLIGGENHKTGQGIPTIQHYESLERFGHETFGIKEIPYRWSAQDLTTLDKLPYIGRISRDHTNIYVATGYRKWGITNGTAAALLLTDLITGKDNLYHDVVTPSRFVADPSIKHFVSQNLDVAKHLIQGKVEMALGKPEDLDPDEGAVVSVNGKRAGAYKDNEGNLYLVDTTCTHMGCEVEWNSGDRSWDCPCHGSRFSIEGSVIEGPAKSPLKRLNDDTK
ncbi:FAD-dependent oxidoreductase [Anaerobacillus sp. MEB173]|uniref:FAD-dependent oxidoreductase n=1 Tax=Anaerobacillus sp. MEB173 TaxID=3383345 RepID=UPI003F932862